MASNKVWNYYYQTEAGTGVSWPGSILGGSSQVLTGNLPNGQTIIRSRLQIQIALGCNNLTPMTTVLEPDLLAATQIEVGLYCNPTVANTVAPPAANPSTSDGFWLQKNALTLQDTVYYTTPDGIVHMLGIFTPGGQPFDSHAQRGPATVANAGIHLCWYIGGTSTYWTENTASLSGRWGWHASVAVLLDTAPP